MSVSSSTSNSNNTSFQRVDALSSGAARFRWNKTVQEMHSDFCGYISSSPERTLELIVCMTLFVLGHFLPQLWSPWEAPIPYQVTQAGDVILELDLSHPVQPETVPGWMLIVVGILVPMLLLLVTGICCGPPGDAHASICVYMFAVGISTFLTNMMKLYCGRLRPNFYDMCQFDTSTKECQVDEPNARKSFPSGHSSLSFCSMTILSLYLLGKIGLHRTTTGGRNNTMPTIMAKLLAFPSFLIPMGVAFFVASSRVHDFYHHPVDIMAGAAIGVLCAHFGTSLWYPSIYSEMAGYPLQYIMFNNHHRNDHHHHPLATDSPPNEDSGTV